MKIIRILVLSLILLIGFACNVFEVDMEDKHIIKENYLKGLKVEMYDYSSAFSDSPTHVVINNKKRVDTICVSTNLKDFKFVEDTLKLYFYGAPKKYNTPITISSKTLEGIVIVLDTSVH